MPSAISCEIALAQEIYRPECGVGEFSGANRWIPSENYEYTPSQIPRTHATVRIPSGNRSRC